MGQALVVALALSNAPKEMADPFFPEMRFGKGKWPSMQFAVHQQVLTRIYGQKFPERFDLMSPYGNALSYADSKWNGAKYTKASAVTESQDVIGDYHRAVSMGANLLPFTFYVPCGFSTAGGVSIPNVEETDDPNLIFTASFVGKEVWKDLRLSSFHLK